MKKILSNIFYNATYQIFVIIIPILTVPYVSRILGAQQLGINSFLLSIDTFLGVVILMGLGQLGVRIISKSETLDLKENFINLWKLQLLSGAVVTGLFCIGTFLFVEEKFYYWLQVPVLLSYILDISWFFIGIGEIKTVITRNTAVKIAMLILIFSLVKTKDDLGLYMLINSVGSLLANLFFWISLRKYICGSEHKVQHFSIKRSKNDRILVLQSLTLLVPQIAVQVYTSLDKTLVGWIAGSTQLSYYDQSQKIARIVLSIVTSISVVLMPAMAKIDGSEEGEKKLNQILKVSYDYTLMISLFFASFLFSISDIFVPFFFGASFSSMIPNMKYVSIIIIPIAIGGVFANQFTLAKGMYKEYSIPYVVGAVLNILLNLSLVPVFKANGGTASLIITESIVCILRIFLIRKQVDLKVIFKGQTKFIIATIITLLVGNFLVVININAFIDICLNGLILLIVFVGCLALLKTRILNDLLLVKNKITKGDKK
ncbi:oligosaccharide flippase family protein [Enterococcus durans]|uniref:oligosaccharide flippase family protein n=1 Tax=Enterococcus durans TaxID=53345 RepID=UPI003BCEEF25